MSDPIPPLSVATCTVQFVNVGAQLISRIHYVCEASDGNIERHQSIMSMARALGKLGAQFTTVLSPNNLHRPLTIQEGEIVVLSKRCEETALDLINVLGLGLPASDKVEGWKASLQSIQNLWKQKNVYHLWQRLENYRERLIIELLQDVQQRASNSSRTSTPSHLSLDSDWEGTQSVAWLAKQSKEMFPWRENLLEAVERINHGDLLLTVDGLVQQSHPADLFPCWNESIIRENLIDALLDKLKYEELFDRHDRISTPGPKTFDWILESGGDSSTEARAPITFRNWLSSEKAIYWISGKPGSGKSTMMKSICHDPRTKSLLMNWSGDTPIIMAPFFFWNSGTMLQKSREGLLRSILFQTLSQRKALSSKSIPSKWDAFSLSLTYSTGFGAPRPWEWTELAQALRLLMEGEDDIEVNYVFFIDGLDEFDGDMFELTSLINHLAQYQNVKVCVSSRPWIVFQDTFGGGPTVMLQDHTMSDIAQYVQANLTKNSIIPELARGNPESMSPLVDEITIRAQGVFLWAVLVVRSMIHGMRNGDRIADLQRRLSQLPGDLEDLFKVRLSNKHPAHLQYSCHILEILVAATIPPTVLDLSFANDEIEEFHSVRIKAPVDEEFHDRTTTMKRRLYSRCLGSLDTVPTPPNLRAEEFRTGVSKQAPYGTVGHNHPVVNPKVDYIHRIVRDIFIQEEMRSYLQNHCSPTFDPNACLCRSYLLQLKVLSPHDVLAPQSLFWLYLRCALEHAIAIAATNLGLHIRLLDEIDQAAVAQSTRTDTGVSLIEKYRGKSAHHWSSLLPRAEHDDDFITFAVHCQLNLYVKRKLTSKPRSTEATTRLLHAAISSHESPFPGWRSYTHPDADLVEFLLNSGADPNLKVRGFTSLQCIVLQTRFEQRTNDPTWCKIMELHKKYGSVVANDLSTASKGQSIEQAALFEALSKNAMGSEDTEELRPFTAKHFSESNVLGSAISEKDGVVDNAKPTQVSTGVRRPEGVFSEGTTIVVEQASLLGDTLAPPTVPEVKEDESEFIQHTPFSRQDFADTRSLTSEGDNGHQKASPKTEFENAVVHIFSTNELLESLYEKGLQLMPEDRFINNYRRILKVFYEGVVALPTTAVTHELKALLERRENRHRIVKSIIKENQRRTDPQAEDESMEEYRFREQERLRNERWKMWLDKATGGEGHDDAGESDVLDSGKIESEQENLPHDRLQHGFDDDRNDEMLGDDSQSGDDENLGDQEDTSRDVRDYCLPTFAPVEHHQVVQALVESQPFQDMLLGLKSFLLPDRLLKDILPTPNEHITFESHARLDSVNAFQGWIEDVTGLEWDWWPLSPHMRPLRSDETRVFWRCICGTVRWRELRFAQKDILEDLLETHPARREPKGVPDQPSANLPRLPCAVLKASQHHRTSVPLQQLAPSPGSGAQAPQICNSQNSSAPQGGSAPATNGGQAGHNSQSGGSSTTQIQPSSNNNSSAQTQANKTDSMWLLFGVSGNRVTVKLGQVDKLSLASDPVFLTWILR